MSASVSGFAAVRVADVMRGPVIARGPRTPVQLVAQVMADEHVHAVVITGIEGTAWGVVTALDIAAAAATNEVELVAAELAATEPLTVRGATALSEAARLMAEHQVNHVLVVDPDGRPTGIVSTIDVARCFGLGAG